MTYEQHMADGAYLLGVFYTAIVKCVNSRIANGTLPEGVKEELDSIGKIYDPSQPINRDVGERLKALSVKLEVNKVVH